MLFQLLNLLSSSCKFIDQLLVLFFILLGKNRTKRKRHIVIDPRGSKFMMSLMILHQKLWYLQILLSSLLDRIPQLFFIVQLNQIFNNNVLKFNYLSLDFITGEKTFIFLLEITNFFLDFVVDRVNRQLYFLIEFDSQMLYLVSHPFQFLFILLLAKLLALNKIFNRPFQVIYLFPVGLLS